jgi:hypothetical protein
MTLTGRLPELAEMQGAGGDGWMKVRDGKLADLPVLGDILDQAASRISKVLGGKAASANDRADIEFRFEGNRIYLTKAELIAPTWLLRGAGQKDAAGDIYFNERLDLRLAFTAEEKLLRGFDKLTGLDLSGAWGNIKDRLSHLRVTGTLSEPKVNLTALSRGTGSGDDSSSQKKRPGEKILEGIGKGTKKIGEGLGDLVD